MPPATNNSLTACNPKLNATVSASAGSGKTWLLITRIVRLLIDGAEPGNIIALTFTRKAAGEMQIRLNERLFEMATATEQELGELLQMIGCDSNTQNKTIAAGLYEKLMHSLYPVRIQTFHSFCQDILSRFPLEADIPPGFELLEDSSLLERQAWQMLFDEARTSKQLNKELDNIMQFCNGPDNTLTSLHSFLAHRSDWWAYTKHTKKPVDFACTELMQLLQIDTQFLSDESAPIKQFFNDSIKQKLIVFANLLREINNKTSDKHASNIDEALSTTDKNAQFSLIKSAFLKKDGEALVQGRKHSAATEKKLGTENTEKFLVLHAELAEKIQQVSEQLKRLLTLKINTAWYFSGSRYVEIYQQLKTEMRLLDFTDLEWKCYELLQHADNAHWVQYKIDQRIDHILIDEFQDTNPTQWHLLSPILEEIAANPEQRPRSVFLVGDEKQSIYSFRRANPALQAQASKWLTNRLDAKAAPLDFSRRSSNAIIHCVNQIFQQPDVQAIMPGFTTHGTHLKDLPGKVSLCDLFEEEEPLPEDNQVDENQIDKNAAIVFRNPLQQPREISNTTLRHKEADYIAQQILHLKNASELITDNNTIRPIEFGDILILMRNRTHIGIYEEALKQHGIPFIGNKKGGLLDNLEIQDLSCLLNTLITPYNNLAFAQVLKSPIFSASDDDLILLTMQTREKTREAHWYKCLLLLATENNEALSKPLQRAAKLLPRWQQLTEQLPVHDALDKIFSEGNIINRYIAANQPQNKTKVAANCQRFLELSLETDSGRYPSITRFLQRLNHLQNYSSNPPEEPLSQSDESRVRLMTIHGSKGLESPIVFLADCNSTASNKNAYASLVQWPANKTQPTNFQLQLSKDNTDEITQQLQQKKLGEQKREELNLLYVALTRSREQLYISGVGSNRGQESSWYKIISNGLDNITERETNIDNISCKVYKHLVYDYSMVKFSEIKQHEEQLHIDKQLLKRLLKPLKNPPTANYFIAPSWQADERTNDSKASNATASNNIYSRELAKWRGTMIHKIIEQLCNTAVYPATDKIVNNIQQQIKTNVLFINTGFIKYLDECMQEAVTTFNHSEFKSIFNPATKAKTYNEMPLMYQHSQRQQSQGVYGIIDRVIKSGNEITIVDYKSHPLNENGNKNKHAQDVALQFSQQMDYYRNGINKLWPEHTVKTGILFTHDKKIVWLG
ncbi:ATP-dependent nuclease subunit A [hydrothermal vent metagenome]|uniref:DNA 3'-5' helicase n=1 Tax=hydrothermal vent metagenome TaxID=652676 RepID=A0A3B0WPL1_9ZZZZ